LLKRIFGGYSGFAVAAVLFASTGHAGLKAADTVSIDSVNRTAFGAFGSVRNSANAVEFMYCYAYHYASGSSTAVCSARNSAGVTLTCSSTSAPIVAAADSLSGDSQLYFQADASGNCVFVRTLNSSQYPPKAP
jgi:hypothetical protein